MCYFFTLAELASFQRLKYLKLKKNYFFMGTQKWNYGNLKKRKHFNFVLRSFHKVCVISSFLDILLDMDIDGYKKTL